MNFKRLKIIAGFVGPKMPNLNYKKYVATLKNCETTFNKASATKFTFVPTANRITNFYGGGNAEILSNMQSAEFVDNIYTALNRKGYGLPEKTVFTEEAIPSFTDIGGMNSRKEMAFNPRAIHKISVSCIFHEFGHLLHGKYQKNMMISDLIIRRKDKFIPFLSKKEKEIFMKDIERATNEQMFKGVPYKYWLKDKLFMFGELKNKDIRDFRKNAAERNAKYPLTDRFEFVADVFGLRLQGFKFSPEMIAKYEKFGGPEIKGVFSPEELDAFFKLQKTIRKKSLADYGITQLV